MSNSFHDVFENKKYIIAGVHFLPLPGSPKFDKEGGMKKIIERAREDTHKLVENGVHGILFTNEADTPYQKNLSPESLAAFTTVVNEVMQDYSVPFGLNVLLDPLAGISIAHATGASFVRGYFAGAYVTDMGIMDTSGYEAAQLKSDLKADQVFLLHNLVCAFGEPLVNRPIDEEAQSIMAHVGPDGFTISGRSAGFSPDQEDFKQVSEVLPNVPIVVGTGANINNIDTLLELADGAIVVTSLRKNKETLNRVDPKRVKRFMDKVHKINN